MNAAPIRDSSRAFTLVEVIVAVGITATAVLTVFALLVPARDGAREAALTAAAARLQPALVRDLREQGAESLFELFKDAGDAAFAIYQVRAVSDIERAPEEGDLEVAIEGNAGDDYVVVTVTRDLSDPAEVAAAETDMGAVEGSVFVVLLGSDVSDELQPDGLPASFDEFDRASLILSAAFVEVPSGRPATEWAVFARSKRPVLEVPVAVRR